MFETFINGFGLFGLLCLVVFGIFLVGCTLSRVLDIILDRRADAYERDKYRE